MQQDATSFLVGGELHTNTSHSLFSFFAFLLRSQVAAVPTKMKLQEVSFVYLSGMRFSSICKVSVLSALNSSSFSFNLHRFHKLGQITNSVICCPIPEGTS